MIIGAEVCDTICNENRITIAIRNYIIYKSFHKSYFLFFREGNKMNVKKINIRLFNKK